MSSVIMSLHNVIKVGPATTRLPFPGIELGACLLKKTIARYSTALRPLSPLAGGLLHSVIRTCEVGIGLEEAKSLTRIQVFGWALS